MKAPAADKEDGAVSSPQVVVVLLLAAIAALWNLLSADQVPIERDLLVFVIPFKHFLGESLRRGEIPLWNPWIFLGAPFVGSLQSCVFYPPSLLLLLPFPLGFDLLLSFHYGLALAGMWLLLRDAGFAALAAAVGALTFAFGGYLVSLVSLTNHLQGAAWAPLFLLVWRRWSRNPWLCRLPAVVVVLALQLLAGSPEHSLMTVAAALVWTLLERPWSWGRTRRQLSMLFAAAVVVAGLTAFQTLPTAEYLAHSERGHEIPASQALYWSLAPRSFLTLFFPGATAADAVAPLIGSLYLGLASLCFAITGLVVSRNRWPWLVLSAAGILLGLGKHASLLAVLYDLAPEVFARFRYPQKFYFWTHLAASFLAAEGAARIALRDRASTRIVSSVAALLLLALPTTLWALDSGWAIARNSWHSAAILGLLLALPWLHSRRLVGEQAFALLLVSLVAVDLLSASGKLRATVSWTELRSRPPVVDVHELRATRRRIFHYQAAKRRAPAESQDDPGLERWPIGSLQEAEAQGSPLNLWPTLFADIGMVYGVASLDGAEGLSPRYMRSFLDKLSRLQREDAIRLLRTFSVAYLIGPDPRPSPSLERIYPSEPSPFFIYRVHEPLPVAYLVSRLREKPNPSDALQELAAPDFEPGREAIVNRLPPQWVNRKEDGETAGDVVVLSYTNDRVRLRATCHDRRLLVLNEAFFPGWEVSVDGTSAEILQTNAIVRGVVVDRGDHVVEFTYRPPSFRWGLVISTSALAVLVAVMVIGRRAERGGGLARPDADRP